MDEKIDQDAIFSKIILLFLRLGTPWHENIPLWNFPTSSSDLNTIENLWSILAREVYKNGRQYSTFAWLKVEIFKAWRQFQHQTLKDLVNSIPRVIFAVINN
jgi:hypothetical protein